MRGRITVPVICDGRVVTMAGRGTAAGHGSPAPVRPQERPEPAEEAGRRTTAGCLARVTLVGNLGLDPERRTTQDGRAVARLRVAVNTGRKDREGNWQDHTDWYSATVFGPLAERALERLAKGLRVYVEGRLETRVSEGAGGPRIFLDVVANDLFPLDRLDRPSVGRISIDAVPDDADDLPL